MKETRISLPELALIAGTRAALGAGIGLLLADRLPESQRKSIGWTLFLVGAVTTIPLAFEVLGGGRLSHDEHDEGIPEPPVTESRFEPQFQRRNVNRPPVE